MEIVEDNGYFKLKNGSLRQGRIYSFHVLYMFTYSKFYIWVNGFSCFWFSVSQIDGKCLVDGYKKLAFNKDKKIHRFISLLLLNQFFSDK